MQIYKLSLTTSLSLSNVGHGRPEQPESILSIYS